MDFSFLDTDDLEITLAEAACYWCEVSPSANSKAIDAELRDQVDKRRRILEAKAEHSLKVRVDYERHSNGSWVSGRPSTHPKPFRTTVTLSELRRWFETTRGSERPAFLFTESRPDWIGDSGGAFDRASEFSLEDAARAFAGSAGTEAQRDEWLTVLIRAAKTNPPELIVKVRESWRDSGGSLVLLSASDPAGGWLVTRAELRRWAAYMKGQERARFLFPLGDAARPAEASEAAPAVPEAAAKKGTAQAKRADNTLLRLVAVLASEAFGGKAGAEERGRVTEIHTAAQNLGISLSDDTIRARMKEALELLSSASTK